MKINKKIMTISVVTPSYNQAQFLSACIESVARQSKPALEHLIFDPGSTDGSLEIAAQASSATLIHEPDEGQADAVGKGFLRARGDVLAWLNSDDAYASHEVFSKVIERFEQADKPDIVYGRGAYVDEAGNHLRDAYVNEKAETLPERLAREVGILQPALFLRRSVVERIGIPKKELNFCLDYEYWIRAMKAGLTFAFLPEVLAHAHYYPDNKTLGLRGNSLLETCKMVKSEFGYTPVEWLRRLAEFNIAGHDGILRSGSGENGESAVTRETVSLAKAFNCTHDTLVFLDQNRSRKPCSSTVVFMEEHGLRVKPFAEEINLDQASVPRKVCYTVAKRRWAFPRQWKAAATARSAQEFDRIRENRQHDTCVIVGNGPSLNQVDFSLLSRADVFISNYAFLKPELLEHANYLSVVNNLVAEQGAEDFNLLKKLRKFFPYWLRYCIEETDNTFFVNSVGYEEFSKNINENISWRSTVTFFQLQLAYGLGYRKAIMVGFDHFYKQQATAQEGDELDCREDDANHFDANYFKDKKWHAADVAKMEAVYRLAKTAFEEDGREIVNCTVGGKLELFRRSDLEKELMTSKTMVATTLNTKINQQLPRVLILDATPSGGLSATGTLKADLFEHWPDGNLLQISSDVAGNFTLTERKSGQWQLNYTNDGAKVAEKLLAFAPQVVYFRPLDDPYTFNEKCFELINGWSVPLVVHYMDDWLSRVASRSELAGEFWKQHLQNLMRRAAACLAISEPMAKQLSEEHNRTFDVIANGIKADQWRELPARKREAGQPFCITYSGMLADDMTFRTVCLIVDALRPLGEAGLIQLNLRTGSYFHRKAWNTFSMISWVNITEIEKDRHQYRQDLAANDLLLIAYNFDSESTLYTRYSRANKLPECLAAGTRLMVVGPQEAATIQEALKIPGVAVITNPSKEAILNTVKAMIDDPIASTKAAAESRAYCFEHMRLEPIQERFEKILGDAAFSAKSPHHLPAFPRQCGACVDEVKMVFNLYEARSGHGQMVDVGAHHGSSLGMFARLGWDVLAFEPDPVNRDKLLKNIQHYRTVKIDPRAVSDSGGKEVPFFSSDESSGISSMKAFRETHREADRVQTVTLEDALQEYAIHKVDFLKIDAEGFDFHVLKGLNFNHIAPEVIIVEFEDIKTLPLGYTYSDMADLLVDKGYTVFVSEWHPIVRYGIRHQWKCFRPYPVEGMAEDAWGNLIAFKQIPQEAELQKALRNSITFYSLSNEPKKAQQAAPAASNERLRKLEEMIRNRDMAIDRAKQQLGQKDLMINNRDVAILELKNKISKLEQNSEDYQTQLKELKSLWNDYKKQIS